MDQLIKGSALKIAEAIRRKEISSTEVVGAYLKRIANVNPKLNAIVQLSEEKAKEQALEADNELNRGNIKGPLHGVPITLKDSFDSKDFVSTGGTMGRKNFIPSQDATVLARLRDAGAILLGKTNTPEFTLAYETDNLIYGKTSNPYDTEYSSGGSSGGAAAIVAAAGSAFDIGSDYGGSLRYPSHCCGISTIKPTSGRVPRTGHILPFGGLLDSLQQVGPIARYVEDLNFILPVISGPDWIDPSIVPMPHGDPREVDIKKLRICFYTDNGIISPSAETINTIKRVATLLDQEGCIVEEKTPNGIERTYDIMLGLLFADGEYTKRILNDVGTKEHTLPWLELVQPIDTIQLDSMIAGWYNFRSTMFSFIKDYDVILCPVNAFPALPHGSIKDDLSAFSYTMAYNLTGWPSSVVRGGTSSNNLPIGIQVVAQPWREDVSLAVAGYLENELGGYQQPDF